MMLVKQQIHTHSTTSDKMRHIVESIVRKNYAAAREGLDEAVALIMERKLFEMKKRMMAELDTSKMPPVPASDIEDRRADQKPVQDGKGDKQTSGSNETIIPKNNIKEEDQLDEARIKIVKARIRGGKIQRRKKISNVPGMTLRGGKLKRMSPAERRRRKMGQRRGKIKRRSKMTQTLMKRSRSMRKRKTLGL